MTWLTWRQLRAQATAVYAAVLALAVVLAVTGPRLTRLGQGQVSLFDQLTRSDRNLYYAGIVVLALAPAVIGAFWGAPLVARELEAGTHRLVWNQSITRTRWLATKLVLTLLCAAIAVGVLSLAVTWWSAPLDGATGSQRGSLPSRLTPIAFSMRDLVPVAYTVFAVSLGTALGVLLRRALPAMALTLAVTAFVQIAVPLWVRPHLLPPTSQLVVLGRDTLDSIMADETGTAVRIGVRPAHRGDWVLSQQTVDSAGQAVALPSWFNSCVAPPPPVGVASQRSEAPDVSGCFSRLTAEGYQQHVVYQPVSRFWPLQWAETALLLVLSALLAVFTFQWTRRLS
ncbi:MAG: putative transrane transport protein [Frankiales bacterium]|nr:putative transrane transport protein [Frankiales bacterium]